MLVGDRASHPVEGRIQLELWQVGRGLRRGGPSPSRRPALIEVALELFLDLRLRPGRRSIAFTETLAASPIPPLDKAGSQIIASAIPTEQFLLFRLASRLLAGLPCGLGLVPATLFGADVEECRKGLRSLPSASFAVSISFESP